MNLCNFNILMVALLLLVLMACREAGVTTEWPEVVRENKPWTRWWWHGSAVTREGITAELEAYKKAGLGGVEITPVYGVYGEEKSFIDYLSPRWMDMLEFTLEEAERLDLGVDMATGTGWPFGGPWVGEADACKDMNYKVYQLGGGESIREPVRFHQEPYVRSVGTQVYEMHGIHRVQGQSTVGTVDEPMLRRDARPITIGQLVEPVEANKNLQALALDQVKYDKQLEPVVLMAYGERGEELDLTGKINEKGMLDWVAPSGHWKLYALFPGSHGKMVERAAPGGEGNVIDHFSAEALMRYLTKFDSAFAKRNIGTLRAFFNDSYEVDDARGTADWTPGLFEAFAQRRGYDLREHLPQLFSKDTTEENKRVLCDYRETVSELVHDNFTAVWKRWAGTKGKIVRNQAHGSPANILDLYAEVDIPEIEGNEPLRIKMASSAANVSGKRLTSSESATWLNEHFMSNLSDIKKAVDLFLVNGVNHIFYHGTCYSPPGETWPGRLFYASVHLNPRNSLWTDFGKLNAYVARSQSFLQRSRAANDVLLYFPVYDRFSTPGREMLEHFDGVGSQFDGTAFKDAAEKMLEQGFLFDYISDKQIRELHTGNGEFVTSGNARYKTLVIPHCKFIPLETLAAVMKLAGEGARVIFYQGLPESVAGYAGLAAKLEAFGELITGIDFVAEDNTAPRIARQGQGTLLQGSHLDGLLMAAGVERETLSELGFQFIRRRNDAGVIYFITNWSDHDYEGWVRFPVKGRSAKLFDPMSGVSGMAGVRIDDGRLSVRLQLGKGESVIVQTADGMVAGPPFPYLEPEGDPITLAGPWRVSFIDGGPALPRSTILDSLVSWTALPDSGYAKFSGTASYQIDFEATVPDGGGFLLDLGSVKESCQVILNGEELDTLIGPEYTLYIEGGLLKGMNLLEVHVSNLMANRIADLDRRGVFWKKFYNVNFPARLAVNRRNGLFSAAGWPPTESGLIGPVKLIPVAKRE